MCPMRRQESCNECTTVTASVGTSARHEHEYSWAPWRARAGEPRLSPTESVQQAANPAWRPGQGHKSRLINAFALKYESEERRAQSAVPSSSSGSNANGKASASVINGQCWRNGLHCTASNCL